MATHLSVFLLALLLTASSPYMHVARCQSDLDEQATEGTEGSDIGIVNDESPDYGDRNFNPVPVVTAGEEPELLVGMKNDGETSLDVIAIRASVHLPANHEWLIQNLTAQGFRKASVPVKTQATFPYIYAVSKFLQASTYDLVGTIFYEIEQQPYHSTFYNGTIEVVEAGGPLSMESVLLVTFGVALVILTGLWIRGQIHNIS